MFHSKNATYFLFFAQVRFFWCWSVYSGSASTRYLRAGARCARDTAAQQVTLRGLKPRAGRGRAGALRRRPLRAGASKATRLFPFSFWKFSQQITSTRKGNGVRFSRIHRVPLRDRAPDRTPGGANVDAEGGAALARARSRAGGACAPAPARHTRCDPCSVPGFRFATSG